MSFEIARTECMILAFSWTTRSGHEVETKGVKRELFCYTKASVVLFWKVYKKGVLAFHSEFLCPLLLHLLSFWLCKLCMYIFTLCRAHSYWSVT